MKKLLLALALFTAWGVHAQEKFKPEIKQGSKLTYLVNIQGQDIPLIVSYDSIATDYLKLGWNIESLGTGSWIAKKNSIDNATRGMWDEPAPGVDAEISDDQSVLMLSKAQWKSLKENNKFDYDLQSFVPQEATESDQLMLNDKPVDVLLVKGENGSTRLWILNNESLPLILKIEGNTMGPDLGVSSIE